MSTAAVTLHGFAYGEHFEGVARRSLGFRLIAPLVPQSWSAEVEELARRLQAAPYPDHWPVTDLFCSVLLDDQHRLLALTRYGVADHTASQRRGGLEMVGVVAPATLDVPAALTVYRWLRRRRAELDDLQAFGGTHTWDEVAAAAPAASTAVEPRAQLPACLGQEGMPFVAAAPTDPDQHLYLLEREAATNWQWLPLVGADFPLQTYARRGPLRAWTLPVAGTALTLDRSRIAEPPTRNDFLERLRAFALPGALGLVLVLLGANLWATLAVLRRQSDESTHRAHSPSALPTVQPSAGTAAGPFAATLHEMIQTQTGPHEWEPLREQLLTRYDRLLRDYPKLRVEPADTKGKQAVGMVHLLTQRGSKRMREVIQTALTNRGYDPGLIQAACDAIQQQLALHDKESGPR